MKKKASKAKRKAKRKGSKAKRKVRKKASKTKAASAFRRYLKLAPRAKDAKMIRARLAGLGK